MDNKVGLDQQDHQEAPGHQVLQEPQLHAETILNLKAHSLRKKSKLQIFLVLTGQL
jgi:hypothetical protein